MHPFIYYYLTENDYAGYELGHLLKNNNGNEYSVGKVFDNPYYDDSSVIDDNITKNIRSNPNKLEIIKRIENIYYLSLIHI